MAGKKKNPSAVDLGRLGGRARSTALSEKSRKEIASGAGKSAWAGMTAEERSAEMKRRAEKRKKKVLPPKTLEQAVEIELARRATLRVDPDMNPMDIDFSELMPGEMEKKLESFLQLHAQRDATVTVTLREIGIASGAATHRDWKCSDNPRIRQLARRLAQFIGQFINSEDGRRFAGASVAMEIKGAA